MKLNTFNDVAKRYSEIKPLVSKHHTLEDDVRPIADRRRKHQRIHYQWKTLTAMARGTKTT